MTQKPRPAPISLPDDPLIRGLSRSIRYAVRVLAVLMVLVIWWGVADVAYEVSSDYVFATAALMLALAVAYWLAVVKNASNESHGDL